METIDLRSLGVLEAIAREGGFSAAGRRLGLSRAAVSRTVSNLEALLGVRLFRRTTRRVVLTEAAERLVAGLAGPLAEVRAVLETATADEQRLSGLVRLSASDSFGRRYVARVVAEFVAAQPSVQVELQLADRVEDLVGRTVDVAVRLGPLRQGSTIARRVGRLPLVLVAVPELAGPDPLALPAVGFRVPDTRALYPWPLGPRPAPPVNVRVTSDSIEGVAELCRLGVGAALLPRYLVEDDVAAGRLVELVGPVDGPEVNVCTLDRTLQPPRVRAVIRHLVEALSAELATPRRRRPRR